MKIGDRVRLWVDDSGNQAQSPTPTSRAGREAILTGFLMWYAVAVAAALLAMFARNRADRVRAAGWDREIESWACDGGLENRR